MTCKRGLSFLVLCVIGVAIGFHWLRGAQTKPAPPFSRGRFQESTPELLESSILPADHSLASTTTHDEWPALATGSDNTVAVAWVAFDDQDDWLRVATSAVGSDGSLQAVTLDTIAGPGAFVMPTATFDSEGRLWVVWCSRETDAFDLYARRCVNGTWSDILRLTDDAGPDARPSVAADDQGNVWLAWQAYRNGSLDIFAAQLTRDGLVDQTRVTSHPASDWAPTIAVGTQGIVHVAWDTYRNHSYDVYVRSLQDGQWSDVIPVAATPRREANASIAVAPDGNLWIGYDVGEENWGRHVRLHATRHIEIRCLKDGQVGRLTQPLTLPFRSTAQPKQEWPHLTFDKSGQLWVGFMRYASAKPKLPTPARSKSGRPKRRRSQKVRGAFFLYATHFDGQRWAAPVALGTSSGRGHDRLRIATLSSGLPFATWAADDRKLPYNEVGILGNIHSARLADSLPARLITVGTTQLQSPTVEAAPADPIDARPHLTPVQLGTRTYRLVFGDTHRHTDISRCNYSGDGTLTDAYRYALDVASLDFLAISDHDQDLNGWRQVAPCPVFKNALWWRSQKYADLHTLPGRFEALYGYERGRTTVDGGGHKNVVSSHRGLPVYSMNPQAEFFGALSGADAVVIPHQLADGGDATDWTKWNESFERVAEIYQARGSYERDDAVHRAKVWNQGHSINDALQNGVRIGIIASSDHGSTHNAYAGVYVREFSKEAIVAGLRARRTFGATELVELSSTLNGHPMGSELTIHAAPRLDVKIHSYAPLARIDVIRDNEIIFSQAANGEDAAFSLTDTDLQAGRNVYYYVRVSTENEAQAWTSPIWVNWPNS